jgi:hypothetical protein
MTTDRHSPPAPGPAWTEAFAALLDRLRPDRVPAARALLLSALARACGDPPDPEAAARLLADLRLALSLSGADLDYADHYARMHQAGVDFLALARELKEAERGPDPAPGGLAGGLRRLFGG